MRGDDKNRTVKLTVSTPLSSKVHIFIRLKLSEFDRKVYVQLYSSNYEFLVQKQMRNGLSGIITLLEIIFHLYFFCPNVYK